MKEKILQNFLRNFLYNKLTIQHRWLGERKLFCNFPRKTTLSELQNHLKAMDKIIQNITPLAARNQ